VARRGLSNPGVLLGTGCRRYCGNYRQKNTPVKRKTAKVLKVLSVHLLPPPPHPLSSTPTNFSVHPFFKDSHYLDFNNDLVSLCGHGEAFDCIIKAGSRC